MAVGYLAELLMAYFGDGCKLGVTIRYSREEHPLGTAGPLRLINGLDEPFLVMNGDLLTTLNYRAMWEQHCLAHPIATLATYKRDVQIDLGVIETDNQHEVRGYVEKPTYHYTVSTGVYVFSPSVLEYIPCRERMDLPELILKLLAAEHRVVAYPFTGRWLDIGRPDDYERAISEFEQHRAEFLPVASP